MGIPIQWNSPTRPIALVGSKKSRLGPKSPQNFFLYICAFFIVKQTRVFKGHVVCGNLRLEPGVNWRWLRPVPQILENKDVSGRGFAPSYDHCCIHLLHLFVCCIFWKSEKLKAGAYIRLWWLGHWYWCSCVWMNVKPIKSVIIWGRRLRT